MAYSSKGQIDFLQLFTWCKCELRYVIIVFNQIYSLLIKYMSLPLCWIRESTQKTLWNTNLKEYQQWNRYLQFIQVIWSLGDEYSFYMYMVFFGLVGRGLRLWVPDVSPASVAGIFKGGCFNYRFWSDEGWLFHAYL